MVPGQSSFGGAGPGKSQVLPHPLGQRGQLGVGCVGGGSGGLDRGTRLNSNVPGSLFCNFRFHGGTLANLTLIQMFAL